jgi:hypothetical protein
MRGTYLDADTIFDAKNAYACGVSLAQIAGQVRISFDELRAAMDLPQWRDLPQRQSQQR